MTKAGSQWLRTEGMHKPMGRGEKEKATSPQCSEVVCSWSWHAAQWPGHRTGVGHVIESPNWSWTQAKALDLVVTNKQIKKKGFDIHLDPASP